MKSLLPVSGWCYAIGLRTAEPAQFWVGNFSLCAASRFFAWLDASFRAWAILSCVVAGRIVAALFTGRAALD